jgi:hypothetical protein
MVVAKMLVTFILAIIKFTENLVLQKSDDHQAICHCDSCSLCWAWSKFKMRRYLLEELIQIVNLRGPTRLNTNTFRNQVTI